MRECPACSSCFDEDITHCPIDNRATFHSLPGGAALDGRYVLERRLGEGGMGIVYKAHHKFLKTTRAIKVIKPELVGNDGSFATRFQQEAMAAAAIGHPNIISVPDYGFLGGEIPFLVMEFIEGDSLQDVMSNEGKFPPEKALEYIRVIASGVGAAHANGIVHRDLKPLNIMIQRNGTPREAIRILDFGLAKIKSGDMFGSFVGAKTTGIIGSPYYMAPEQWSDEEADKRCDIYSLGIILHQMLTGDVPFKGSSIPAVMKKHLMSPPPPLADIKGGISPELESVVHHALQKDPKLRTASAEELVAELEHAMAAASATGKPATKRRTITKTKTGSSKAKGSLAARITGEQKPAQQEAHEPARSTAEQPEALRNTQQEELPQPLEGATIITNSQAFAEAEPEATVPEEGSATPNHSPAMRISRPPEVVPEPPVAAPSVPKRTDVLSRAAEDARQRAVERALRESEGGNVLVGSRSTSLPPQSRISAQLASPTTTPAIPNTDSIKKIGIAVGVLVILAVAIFAVVHFWPSSEKPLENVSETSKTPIQRNMILIQGGSFMMGANSGPVEQQPAHSVSVASFYLDKLEVTNGEYAAFIKATGRPAPAIDAADAKTKSYWYPWRGNDPPIGRENWPVTNVTTKDAEDYAQWLSKLDGVTYRLPDEQEWEYAARNGSDATSFPWGNSWIEGRANLNKAEHPTPVGSYPSGATRSGVMDLAGNVWEWTSSKGSFYDPSKENADEKTANRSANIVRGGAYASEANNFVCTYRAWNNKNFQYKHPAIGFRLARDAK
jgi:eukaryotic-like serine/threonine-protein kinase